MPGSKAITLCTIALGAISLMATLALGPVGLDVPLEKAMLPGLACGVCACVLAFRMRGRRAAGLVLLLAMAAAVLAGPVLGFMLVFGVATGLGGLLALVGSTGAGMQGVPLQVLGLLSVAVIALCFFASQGWAVARALAERRRTADPPP